MPPRSKAAPIAAESNSLNTSIPKRWFVVAQAALYIVASEGYVRQLIHDRKIQATRLGSTFRIDKVDLDRFLESRKKLQGPYRTNTRPWVAERWVKHRAEKQKRAAR